MNLLIAENPFKERFRTWIKQSVCKYELMGLKINGMWIYELFGLKVNGMWRYEVFGLKLNGMWRYEFF